MIANQQRHTSGGTISQTARKAPGLYWFTNDLRLGDNAALRLAAHKSDQLFCVYCIDPAWFRPNRYTSTRLSANRWSFLRASLQDLDKSLRALNQHLLVRFQAPGEAVAALIAQHRIVRVFGSRPSGFYEAGHWSLLQETFPDVEFHQLQTHSLFDENDLPFKLLDMPAVFSPFRRQVEHLPVSVSLAAPDYLPPPLVRPVSPALCDCVFDGLPASFNVDFFAGAVISKGTGANNAALKPEETAGVDFTGGEGAARTHLNTLFGSRLPLTYKETRNALTTQNNTTCLSPWLANGNVSARQIVAALQQFETREGTNESTRWIFFELLWREYFWWAASRAGPRLFSFQGTSKSRPLTSFYPERFRAWCLGTTPYPLVNACMKELSATGFITNRARQIVASCLVNELQLDWRCGAAWFEKQLIDYDVASNWGNWQYIAGVGADPRGGRHFNLEKQASQFDPDQTYTRRWLGNDMANPADNHYSRRLDWRDAADWPIDPDDTTKD